MSSGLESQGNFASGEGGSPAAAHRGRFGTL